MFTGIIEDVGKVTSVQQRGGDTRLTVSTDHINTDELKRGDSMAINGACMTVLEIASGQFSVDVSRESLTVTALRLLRPQQRVNLERALKLSDRLDGHLVSGHVDAVARVMSIRQDARSWRVRFMLPSPYAKYIAAKGSVTLDGVSLTVNDVCEADFGVNIIPHTFNNTIFSDYKVGYEVNFEVDLIARYAARLLHMSDTSVVT